MKNSIQINKQSGNALVYVLIAIALFAALSMTLGRQTDTNEAGALSDDQAELYASQLISYTAQAKSVLDQMDFIGTDIDELGFSIPGQPAFTTSPNIHKVFHPDGGGLNYVRLRDEITTQSTTDPVAGWYMGAFNNIEWTDSAGTDVILVAYQINQTVCESLNEKITGSTAIPVMGDSIKDTMIDDTFHTGSNVDFTTDPAGTPICADCHNRASLCVQNQAGDAYRFYTILKDR